MTGVQTCALPISSTTFDFIGSTAQGWSDEGFGLDNIVITTDAQPATGVPVPAPLALIGLGLAGMGMVRRAKR